MRKEKELISILNRLVKVIAEEADINSQFAEKLYGLLASRNLKETRPKIVHQALGYPLPDIYSEIKIRGEIGFRLWLKDQSIITLRALIRKEDIDPSRRTSKWKDTEKLSQFIADAILLRQTKGSAFIGRDENKLEN